MICRICRKFVKAQGTPFARLCKICKPLFKPKRKHPAEGNTFYKDSLWGEFAGVSNSPSYKTSNKSIPD